MDIVPYNDITIQGTSSKASAVRGPSQTHNAGHMCLSTAQFLLEINMYTDTYNYKTHDFLNKDLKMIQ